jgi:hypothetical protein
MPARERWERDSVSSKGNPRLSLRESGANVLSVDPPTRAIYPYSWIRVLSGLRLLRVREYSGIAKTDERAILLTSGFPTLSDSQHFASQHFVCYAAF